MLLQYCVKLDCTANNHIVCLADATERAVFLTRMLHIPSIRSAQNKCFFTFLFCVELTSWRMSECAIIPSTTLSRKCISTTERHKARSADETAKGNLTFP